jgi:hypothetical protein
MANKIDDNDNRAKQSLELFRNWITKHPFLKYTGDGKKAYPMISFYHFNAI